MPKSALSGWTGRAPAAPGSEHGAGASGREPRSELEDLVQPFEVGDDLRETHFDERAEGDDASEGLVEIFWDWSEDAGRDSEVVGHGKSSHRGRVRRPASRPTG